jgi:hypothetical protein
MRQAAHVASVEEAGLEAEPLGGADEVGAGGGSVAKREVMAGRVGRERSA